MNRMSTHHKLLTESWSTDVEIVENAIRGFAAERPLEHDCRVVLFEVVHGSQPARQRHTRARDGAVAGWAGPASVADGFVNNRTFADMTPTRIAGHIRSMMFAERV